MALPLVDFGTAPDGQPAQLITLSHAGTTLKLMAYGATLVDFRLDGIEHSLVLGGQTAEAYADKMLYFGATVGPIANRIAYGKAPLGDQVITLECNENGETHLHGGTHGIGQRTWELGAYDDKSCVFKITFPDGVSGMPGPIHIETRYSIDDDGAMVIEITGESPVETFLAPAHHSYWNLDGSGNLTGHQAQVFADKVLHNSDKSIPYETPQDVAETRFDFRTLRPAFNPAGMLDNNFCLPDNGETDENGLRKACILTAGDLALTVATTEPGVQLFDGAGLDTAPYLGHEGVAYSPNPGMAIEPQHWPDAPNKAGFPPITLIPGETYRQISRFHVTRGASR